MAGNKKPRRARKPREVKNHVMHLYDADSPMQGEERIEVLTSVHMAALAFSRGAASKYEWDTIVIAMNVAIVLCESAGNREIGVQALYDTQNAMIDVCERFQVCGSYEMTGDELSAMNGGIHVFEQLVDTVSRRQYTRACAEYTKRLDAGKAVQIRNGKATQRFALTPDDNAQKQPERMAA
jgi:hypothetical protein